MQAFSHESSCQSTLPVTLRLTVCRQAGASRIGNGDETGWQREHTFSQGVMPKGEKVSFRPGIESKESFTMFAWGTAEGTVLPPMYIFKGSVQLQNYMANAHWKGSACFLKKDTHFIDGEVFAEMLVEMAKCVPGGVSPTNRFLLILDGHESRLSVDALKQAKLVGFDILQAAAKQQAAKQQAAKQQAARQPKRGADNQAAHPGKAGWGAKRARQGTALVDISNQLQ